MKRKKPPLRIVASNAEPKTRKSRAWEPTPLERRTIERCMAVGLTLEQTGHVIDRSPTAIKKHCRAEIDHGHAKVAAKVAGTLIKKALAGDVACLIFYAKTRLGWSEKQLHEHSGAGGGPIRYEDVTAEADAFTRRIEQLGHRYLEAQARQIEPEPIQLPPPEPVPPSALN